MYDLPLMEEYPVISLSDPAVNREESDLKRYVETLDQKHLKFDGTPTVFYLRPITAREWAKLVSYASRIDPDKPDLESVLNASMLTLRITLTRVEGFMVNGVPLEIKKGDDGLVDENCLEAFSFSLIQELASASREVSAFPSPQAAE